MLRFFSSAGRVHAVVMKRHGRTASRFPIHALSVAEDEGVLFEVPFDDGSKLGVASGGQHRGAVPAGDRDHDQLAGEVLGASLGRDLGPGGLGVRLFGLCVEHCAFGGQPSEAGASRGFALFFASSTASRTSTMSGSTCSLRRPRRMTKPVRLRTSRAS